MLHWQARKQPGDNAMQPIDLRDSQAPAIQRMAVGVILERRPAEVGKWVDHIWEAVGVVAGDAVSNQHMDEPLCSGKDGIEQYLVGGLHLQLFPDECESYYHNLMSPQPRCYVVARKEDDDARPEPFLVSMSFDEAHAYLEGGDEIFAVGIPPEIYRWTESYVLSYYAPEQRRKRKLTDWSGKAGEPE